MTKLTEFVDRMGRKITLHRLAEGHFEVIKDFYSDGIEGLSDKSFFANFSDDELREVLSTPASMFVGAYDKDLLIGLSALDTDRAYGEGLRANCVAIATKNIPIYEYSGVFVLAEYRRSGIAKTMMDFLIAYAKSTLAPCYLCGVVQYSNKPSAANFLSHGFVWAGRKRKDRVFENDHYLLEL